MAHPIHQFSAIARPVEPQYPTNLAILIVMGVSAGTFTLIAFVRGVGVLDAALAGLMGALVVFVTWALGRDLAPDDQAAAFVALLPAAALMSTGTSPMLMGPMLVLGLIRVVNRTVGPPAMKSDRIILLGLLGLVIQEPYGWSVGLGAIIAFALDAYLEPRQASSWIFSGLALGITCTGLALGEQTVSLPPLGPATMAAIATALGLAVVILTQSSPHSTCDTEPDQQLRQNRVKGGLFVGWVAATGSIFGGDAGVLAWGVLWAACLGVVLTRPVHALRRARA